jgi:hypothetical protein
MTLAEALEKRARSGKLVDQSDFKAGWNTTTATERERYDSLKHQWDSLQDRMHADFVARTEAESNLAAERERHEKQLKALEASNEKILADNDFLVGTLQKYKDALVAARDGYPGWFLLIKAALAPLASQQEVSPSKSSSNS